MQQYSNKQAIRIIFYPLCRGTLYFIHSIVHFVSLYVTMHCNFHPVCCQPLYRGDLYSIMQFIVYLLPSVHWCLYFLHRTFHTLYRGGWFAVS